MGNGFILKCPRNKRITMLACESPAVREGNKVICRDCKIVLTIDMPEPETEEEEKEDA